MKFYSKAEIMQIFEELGKPRISLLWVGKDEEFASISQESTDGVGSHLLRVYVKKPEGYEELPLEEAKAKLAAYLAPHIKAETLLKEVVEKLPVEHFVDLLERVEGKGKVTVGVQKGSCVWLYIKGKRGIPFPLQITE